nr:cell cycle regulator of non-homologous end joining isoform X3 [Camelus dromedarius]
MEALEAGTKKRVLPTWMTAQEVEKRTTQVKIPKRRRTAVVPAATARLPATRTVYCMNEAEIVDVALGILIEFLNRMSPSRDWMFICQRVLQKDPGSYGPNVCAPPPSSYVEILTPKVMVLTGGVWGGDQVMRMEPS